MSIPSTPKEIFLETIKPNGQPERLLRQYEQMQKMMKQMRGNKRFGGMFRGRPGF